MESATVLIAMERFRSGYRTFTENMASFVYHNSLSYACTTTSLHVCISLKGCRRVFFATIKTMQEAKRKIEGRKTNREELKRLFRRRADQRDQASFHNPNV